MKLDPTCNHESDGEGTCLGCGGDLRARAAPVPRPAIRQTHTVATLDVSQSTYDEIAAKLRAAGYDHVFSEGMMDMSGIGLLVDSDAAAGGQDHVASEARLTRAARALAVQTGAPLDKLIDWLCDGGLATMMLAYATKEPTVALGPESELIDEPPRAKPTPPSAHPALQAANDWSELVAQWDELTFGTRAYYDGLAKCQEAWERIAAACGVPHEAGRAFEIADVAQFELMHAHGVLSMDDADRIDLQDERYNPVKTLAEANAPIREGFDWCQPRGFVELATDPDGTEWIRVLRDPSESTSAGEVDTSRIVGVPPKDASGVRDHTVEADASAIGASLESAIQRFGAGPLARALVASDAADNLHTLAEYASSVPDTKGGSDAQV